MQQRKKLSHFTTVANSFLFQTTAVSIQSTSYYIHISYTLSSNYKLILLDKRLSVSLMSLSTIFSQQRKIKTTQPHNETNLKSASHLRYLERSLLTQHVCPQITQAVCHKARQSLFPRSLVAIHYQGTLKGWS